MARAQEIPWGSWKPPGPGGSPLIGRPGGSATLAEFDFQHGHDPHPQDLTRAQSDADGVDLHAGLAGLADTQARRSRSAAAARRSPPTAASSCSRIVMLARTHVGRRESQCVDASGPPKFGSEVVQFPPAVRASDSRGSVLPRAFVVWSPKQTIPKQPAPSCSSPKLPGLSPAPRYRCPRYVHRGQAAALVGMSTRTDGYPVLRG